MKTYKDWEEIERLEQRLRSPLVFSPDTDNQELFALLRFRYEHSILDLTGDVSVVDLLEDEEIETARRRTTISDLLKQLFDTPEELSEFMERAQEVDKRDLDYRQRQKEHARKHRQRTKGAPAVYAATLWALRQSMTAADLWKFLDPEEGDRTLYVFTEGGRPVIEESEPDAPFVSVYRTSGDKVQQCDNRTGATAEVGYRTLGNYVLDARRELRQGSLER